MKRDIGFWDINGNYIEDIQEIGAEEMDKNFNEFFDKLNDMANFKNFGESKEEEIIINGVDVAECEHLKNDGIKKPICRSGGCIGVYKSCLCTDNSDCDYKQLKRLQQDYVNLSKSFEHLKTSYQENQEYILQLKDENARLKNERTADLVKQIEELKAENESLKDSLKMFSSTLDWALKSQVGLYKRQIDSSVPDDWEYEEVLVLVEQYIEKIKQTFTEIKKIAEKEVKHAPDGETFARPEIKQILQKISECEA